MIDKNVWVDVMKQTVSNIIANGKDVVIPSVRFVNELEAVTDLGGETWWVVRPSLQAGANAGHSSENSVFETDFDRTIRNDGTLEDLYKKIDDILD